MKSVFVACFVIIGCAGATWAGSPEAPLSAPLLCSAVTPTFDTAQPKPGSPFPPVISDTAQPRPGSPYPPMTE